MYAVFILTLVTKSGGSALGPRHYTRGSESAGPSAYPYALALQQLPWSVVSAQLLYVGSCAGALSRPIFYTGKYMYMYMYYCHTTYNAHVHVVLLLYLVSLPLFTF